MPHLGSMPDPKDKPRTLLVGWISRLDLALELGLSVDTLRRWVEQGGEYSAHWLSPGGWRVVLSGQGVTVEFKPLEAGVWTDAKGQRHEIVPSEEDRRCKPGFHGQMAAFCRLVRGEDPGWPAQDLAGAHRTMQLAARMTAAVADRPEGGGK